MKDNIYCTGGDLAANQQLVVRTVIIAKEPVKTPCTPDEARDILGLK